MSIFLRLALKLCASFSFISRFAANNRCCRLDYGTFADTKLIHGDIVVVELNPREFWSVREGFHEVCSIQMLWSTYRVSGSILLTSAYLF